MKRLDAVVARHDINQHPFYRAWRAGTLPRAALAAYAADYAPFIEAIGAGWLTLGEAEHASVEGAHARLWGDFRRAAGTSDAAPAAEARALVDVARRAFADPVTAVGALYAFEAQQPGTARSKLDGLVAHYPLPEAAHAYFHAHADDYGERDGLRARAEALCPADLDRAEGACEAVCRAMWGALDGVLASFEPACA